MWLFAARSIDIEQYQKDFWKKIAIACRYGHIGIVDAMMMPSKDLHKFIDCVVELIGEENTINKD
jgi:hypothetical protein